MRRRAGGPSLRPDPGRKTAGTTRRHPGVEIEQAPVSSLLLQVVRAHRLVGTEMLQRIGFVPPHEVVLLYLAGHGRCSQTELVRFMGRDRSTLTNTLQAIERAGLVTRTASRDDGRAMMVSLTRKGRDSLPAIRRTWAELESLTTAGLTKGQRAALIEALGVVRATLAALLDTTSLRNGSRRTRP